MKYARLGARKFGHGWFDKCVYCPFSGFDGKTIEICMVFGLMSPGQIKEIMTFSKHKTSNLGWAHRAAPDRRANVGPTTRWANDSLGP